MTKDKAILLSFDVEEFDLPIEYGAMVSMEEQLKYGYAGLQNLLTIIHAADMGATFYTTAHFALQFPETIQQLAEVHEIASHSFYHSTYTTADLLQSRLQLQMITGQNIVGIRMPRMKPIPMQQVEEAGYLYDSSLNPTWIPGRYNNLKMPRTICKDSGIIRIPVSVTPHCRFPLFWLAFKNLPYKVFLNLALQTLRQDGYLNLYFHPWEFTDLTVVDIPGYIKKDAGDPLLYKLQRLIRDLSKHADFITTKDFLQLKKAI